MRSSLGWLLIAALVHTSAAQTPDIPEELRGWEGWALDGREHLRCPMHEDGGVNAPDGRICVWPGPIEIDADASGARFAQRVEVFAPGILALPGDATAWPQDVASDGRAAPVVERGGRPHLRLAPGTYRITGRYVWPRMPEALALPASVSLVELTVNGARVALPERAGDSLRLGAVREQTQVDRLEVQIYRLLIDRIPGLLRTRLVLNVAGRPREEILGALLPEGFTPMQITGPLPARLQPDGRLRIQLRPGTWTLELEARSASALAIVRAPQSGVPQEVWSFEPVDRLRAAAVEGPGSIDPTQANVPDDWAHLPAYRMAPGDEITVVERSRGPGTEDRNQIVVERNLWWDFAGTGYTFQDLVSGQMQQDWRLEMATPYRLQGARQNGQALLVTQSDEGMAGVELRSPALGLEATGRLEPRGGALPATGWTTRLAGLAMTLRLPPGHRLLAAPGVDSSPSAWLDRWRLLDIFAVLLVAAVAFRVAGVPAALLSLAAFALTHHELPALTWAALNLLVAIAIARAMPEGRVRTWLGHWRAVSLAIVVVMLVPFALSQARFALFPQLEPAAWQGAMDLAGEAKPVLTEIVEAPPAQYRPEASLDAVRDAAVAGVAKRADPDEIVVTGSNVSRGWSIGERYAPGTQLQNGPGVPNWNYQMHRLEWGGPVEPTQTMRLIVLTTVWVSLWRLLGVVLVVVALYAIVRFAYPSLGVPPLDRWLRLSPTAAAVLLAVLLPVAPPTAGAQTPSAELLEQLKQRLSRPPECAPDCVSIARAEVELREGSLEIRLEAHAQARAPLALPEAPQRWQPVEVLLDGASESALARDARGTLLLALPEGVHAVTLRGSLPDTDALRLVFRERPARIEVSAPGWQVAGVDEGRLLADSLSLSRPTRASTAAGIDSAVGPGAARAQREEFPPFVRVTRELRLGLDWTVVTTVERLAPTQGAFTLRLPLLAGESVLTAGLPVVDGHVEIALPAGETHTAWASALTRADALELAAPAAGASSVEVWRFLVGPMWHMRFEATPEVIAPEQSGEQWVHHFEPRPGETLKATVTRPPAIEGPTFAFETVRHALTPGRRSTDTHLEIGYRSTQGGRHAIDLPEGARLRQVLADGAPLVIRDQDGRLELPLQPGEHQLAIDWQTDTGVSLATRPGAVTLGAPASNVATSIDVPAGRWLLAAFGGGVGPAILYWAELAVFIVVALLLGRVARSPLATHEWLLVGLGLSTFSWGVLLLFAVWVFAFEWRRRWAANVAPWVFNGTQIVLALLTLVALGSLLSAIPNGLLGSPDMDVTGAGSHAGHLEWFHDRVEEALPRPVAISISIWFYKAAMLAWALWLSFAVVRWVRWAWDAFGTGRLWQRTRGLANPFRREPAPAPPSAS